MARVYLSLGSNIERHQHISAGLDALSDQFGELLISSVYESKAIGFEGDNFYNLVVGLETELDVSELSSILKNIEDRNGRRRDCPKFSARTLDIDILTYDDQASVISGVELPRQEILKNAFVLWPMAELAEHEQHPLEGKTYGVLWAQFDQQSQQLWTIDFYWRGRQVSGVE